MEHARSQQQQQHQHHKTSHIAVPKFSNMHQNKSSSSNMDVHGCEVDCIEVTCTVQKEEDRLHAGMRGDIYITDADMECGLDICNNNSLAFSPSQKTGETLAKFSKRCDKLKTLGPTPTTVYSQGEAQIRAPLMALLVMFIILLLDKGWEKKNITHRTPRNRQHRIKLGNGLFGTTTLHKYITRNTHCRVSGRRTRKAKPRASAASRLE